MLVVLIADQKLGLPCQWSLVLLVRIPFLLRFLWIRVTIINVLESFQVSKKSAHLNKEHSGIGSHRMYRIMRKTQEWR